MDNLIYSKYNAHRRPEFRLVTEIRESDGEKYVVKRPGDPSAEKHFRQLEENYLLLQDYYLNADVLPVRMEKDRAVFQFVSGRSMKDRLVSEYTGRDNFVGMVNGFFDSALSVQGYRRLPFSSSTAFEEIFGKTNLSGVPAVCPANIDLEFGNFIEHNGRFVCIDYEWVFPFAVPEDFIRYRALHYLHYEFRNSLFLDVPEEEYMGWFGIDKKALKLYRKVEFSFQQYVHGSDLRYEYLYRYLKKSDHPQETIGLLTEQVREKDTHILDLEEKTTLLRKDLDDKDTHIHNLEEKTAVLQKNLGEKDTHIHNLEEKTAVLQKDLGEKDTHIHNLEEKTAALQKNLGEKDTHIHSLEENVSDLRKDLDEKESQIQSLDEDVSLLRKDLDRRDAQIRGMEENTARLHQDLYNKDVHIRNIETIANQRLADIHSLEAQYAEISNSFSWRMTKPLRFVLDHFKSLIRKNENVNLIFRTAKKTLTRGPWEAKALWKSEKARINGEVYFDTLLPADELRRQKKTAFDRKIRFSILVPLYNTPQEYLIDMIHSVIKQTYENWELCLADGSDEEHAYVRKVCKKYARRNRRIRYTKLKSNMGISGNTNACLEMATGDYIALFDHDDLLHPGALYEYMKAICEQSADFMYSDEASFHETPKDAFNHHFKPDFAPDTLRSYNYICHLSVFSRDLLEQAGGLFSKEYDGSQDYDMILRLTERAKRIVHIPKILYYWRAHEASTAESIGNKPYIIEAAHKALAAHLKRVGLKGTVTDSQIPSSYKINYEIEGTPLISIVIPNKDHIDDLSKCLNSIREKSTWKNWEIIVVENNSTDPETFRYYDEIIQDKRIRVVKWEREFNYSAINNFGVGFARGSYILLLNNDIEVITPDWLEQMLMFAQREDVGAVGAMLYYPDDTVQHAGVIIGIGGVAGHSHKYFPRGVPGYFMRMTIAQNLSAVTAACIMISRNAWDDVHGLDEGYAIAFNDVDLCLRIREAGYLIVWTPYAELYHYESKSRGLEDTVEKQIRFKGEIVRFESRWSDKILATGDPYYNPNLTLIREDFSFKDSRG